MRCSLFKVRTAPTMTPETLTRASTKNASAATFAATKSLIFRRLLSAVVCAVSLSWALPVHALLNTWTNPVNGSWSDASKWTGGGVPTGTDSATFNKTGTYTVSFSNVFQNLTDMFITNGTVTFERVASPATLTIVAPGYEDQLTVGNATLNMGLTLPVNITTSSDTIINSGGTINVRAGSLLNVQFALDINSGGTINVSGGGDVLTQTNDFIGSAGGSPATVTVAGVGSTWTMGGGGSIYVGTGGDGALTIQSGGSVSGYSDVIGSSAGKTGTALVTGAGSIWTNTGLTVGTFGTGTFRVENGATVTSGSGLIGQQTGSNGTATITGTGSKWSVGGNLPVGSLGTAALTIADSGTVKVGNGAGQVAINSLSTLNIGEGGLAGILQAGTLVTNGVLNFDHTDASTISAPISGTGQITKVDGAGDTTLANVSAFTGTYSVQGGLMILQGNANGSDYLAAGNGTLRFSGGTVNLGIETIQAAASGAVEYDSASVRGGYLRGPGTHTILPSASPTSFNAVTTFNSTNIVQNGSATLVNFNNGGTLTNNAPLTFNGGVNSSTGVIVVNSTLAALDVGNNGIINVNNGGTINNAIANLINGGGSRTTINSGGAINLLAGTTMELNGALLVNNGTVTGTMNVNYGSLAKGTGTYGVVNVNEGGVYSPGNSPGIGSAASVDFQSGLFTSGAPRLIMELGGTTPGTEYDQLRVAGALTLNGTLDVQLVDVGGGTFSPHAGNSFDLLDWGSLSGTFSAIQLPALSGSLAWNTSQLYTSGVLSVVSAGLPGDYNNNGSVDAADYVVWRKNQGTTHVLPNDPIGGTIGPAHYNQWRAHFGQPPGSGAGLNANAAVPEPATLVLLIIAAAGWCLRRCRDA
jgi:T5SS/PEP-CTERM-associated repeat protein